jgi:hypothetical protein
MKTSIQNIARGLGILLIGQASCGSVCNALSTECPVAEWSMTVSLRPKDAAAPANRFDLRDKPQIGVSVDLLNAKNGIKGVPADEPKVELSRNQGIFAQSPVTLKAANWYSDLLLPEQATNEQLGLIEVQVTLKDRSLQARTGGLHRVFRSPQLDKVQEVAYPSNPYNMAPVKGRTGVQVGTPLNGTGSILISEQYTQGIEDRSWIDLYGPDAMGTVGYVYPSGWDSIRQKQVEPLKAQLVVVSGAVLVYRYDAGTLRNDLEILPLSGSRTSGLSVNEPMIPADGIQLAGSLEESVIALSRPGAVRFFQTDPTSLKPVRTIGEVAVDGMPVIAARDITAAIPAKGSTDYFAVLADSSGRLVLVSLVRSGTAPSSVTSKSIGATVTGGQAVTALALADLDSDGLQDIVLGRTDGTLEWSPQLPDGSFERATALTLAQKLPAYATRLSVGNVTGDSAPDLAVATSTNQVFVYQNHQ